jgi:hypothetical protein
MFRRQRPESVSEFVHFADQVVVGVHQFTLVAITPMPCQLGPSQRQTPGWLTYQPASALSNAPIEWVAAKQRGQSLNRLHARDAQMKHSSHAFTTESGGG